MRRRIQISLFGPATLAAAVFCLPVAAAGGTYPQWGDLEPGPYKVGFRVLERYDEERHDRSELDFRGQRRSGELARPIQISLWYPARPRDTAGPMRYREYVDLMASEVRFREVGPAERQANLRDFLAGPRSRGVPDEQLEGLLDTETAAIRDAAPAAGTFALLIFGPGRGGSAVQHSVICEYLASHGYVVATTPSSIRISRRRGQIEAQIRDLELATAVVSGLPFVDRSRLGLAAFSFSGAIVVLYQMRNRSADAVMSLDGWDGYGGYAAMRQRADYDPAAMRVPYLYMTQDPAVLEDSGWTRHLGLMEELLYSERYLLTFSDSRHEDFSSYAMIESDIPRFNFEFQGRSRIDHRAHYRAVCRYALAFFDAWVRGDAEAQEFLRREPAANGFPEGLVTLEVRPAAPAVPTLDEVMAMLLEENGAATVAQVYREVRARDPHAELFTESALTNLGTDLLDFARAEKAAEIFKLLREVYPRSASVDDHLAQAYLQLGDTELSRSYHESALEKLADDDTTADERKQAIRSNAAAFFERMKN